MKEALLGTKINLVGVCFLTDLKQRRKILLLYNQQVLTDDSISCSEPGTLPQNPEHSASSIYKSELT